MTPQRRGILATALAIGLTLVVAIGIALAVGLTTSPKHGPRDDGSHNQTEITLSGDLWDGTSTTFGPARAYWDLPGSPPLPAYEIPTSGSTAVDANGLFTFNVNVPLQTGAGAIVRPGTHFVTVCATPRTSTSGIAVCTSAVQFKILKGTATFSKASGRPGDEITVSATGWVPGRIGERIELTWDPAGSAIDLGGELPFFPGSSTWSRTFSVPGVTPGTYKIRICSIASAGAGPGVCAKDDTVVKTFNVVPPGLTLNKSSGKSGDAVTVNGSQFFASRTVRLFFGPKGTGLGSSKWQELSPGSNTSTDGNFGPVTITPTGVPGEYTVLACTVQPSSSITPSDECHTFDIGTAAYTILAGPTASPSPTSKPSASPSASQAPAASPSPTTTPSPTLSPSPAPTTAPTVGPASAPPTDPPTTPPTAPPTLEPTAEPTPSPTAKPTITWPEHLHSPGQTSGGGIDLGVLGGISLLALLIAFLVPFPGTLFNKTVEENYEEIQGWIGGLKRRWSAFLDTVARGPLGPVRERLARLLTGRFEVLVFLGLSALIYGFLSPTFGLDTDSLALFLGLLVGLAFITAAFELPLRIYHGRASRQNDRGVLRALWWTLLVAILCVVVSRLADFQPGYLYGLVVSIVFVTEISKRDEGIGNWLAAMWLLGLSFVAWIVLAYVRQGAFEPWLALFLQTVLVTFVVAGIETLAIGLLPMRFLPGHPLFHWRRGAWFVVFALSVMGYLLILVDPANGYLSDDARTPMLIGVIFLLTFGIVSLGTWAYFRYRPSRPGGEQSGEAPAS